MKKIMQWVFAATLVCGASVITSCSDDDDYSSKEKTDKNREEFVTHIRQNMKNLAENLNFYSWTSASLTNQYINMYILNNPEFEKTISSAFFLNALQTLKSVEEGSELEAMGYTMYATVDLAGLNYRFIAKEDFSGFDVELADHLEILLNTRNPASGQVESETMKITLEAGGGNSFKYVVPVRKQQGMAIVILVPKEVKFDLSTNFTGTWVSNYSGSFTNSITLLGNSSYAVPTQDSWSISGEINSSLALPNVQKAADNTTLTFSIKDDRQSKSGKLELGWIQNGRRMVDLSMKESWDEPFTLSKLSQSQYQSNSSILEVLAACMATHNLDEGKLTLLDDLTTTISIKDMDKAIALALASAEARRSYADEETIDSYTQQLNKLMNCEMTCKGVNQTIPMKMVTAKFGVDYWTMPGLKFSDDGEYVPLIDMIDSETMQYGINIIDHAAEPMQQSIIVMRQLLEYFKMLMDAYEYPEEE